jgi:hypothetical protein
MTNEKYKIEMENIYRGVAQVASGIRNDEER